MTPENVQPSTSALIERFHSVLYPFPLERVLDALPSKGWLVPFVEREAGEVKLAGQPSKGNVKLVFDVSNKTVGVRGIDPDEALNEFRELSEFLLKDFGLSPEVRTHYVEFRFVGTVDTAGPGSKTPPEVLEAWWADHPRSSAFARVMEKWLPGDGIGVYGVRMATRGKDANRPNWAELTVGPSATSGTRFYNFDPSTETRTKPLWRVWLSGRETLLSQPWRS